jgi:hypothetical protein
LITKKFAPTGQLSASQEGVFHGVMLDWLKEMHSWNGIGNIDFAVVNK